MRAWLSLFLISAACGDNIDGNRPPTVESFSLTTFEDLAVTRTINAIELDLGDELTVSVSLDPDHGTATTSGLAVTYMPAADYHGSDQFVLAVSDGTEQVLVPIDVTVTSVLDPPFGGEDSIATNEDVPRTVAISQLLDNDSDADGDELTLSSVGNPIHGLVSVNNGNVTFTPDANFNGGASFIYTITDGTFTIPVLVTVVVGGANDAPVAVDDSATTFENTPITIPNTVLVSNDTDPDSQILTVSAVGNEIGGTVTLNNGDVTFTPNTNFSGAASFEYTVTDGIATDVGLVTIDIDAAPVAVDDLADTTSGVFVDIPVLANDTDSDGGPKTIQSVTQPLDGTASINGSAVRYDPGVFVGAAVFTYTLNGGSTATVTVTVL